MRVLVWRESVLQVLNVVPGTLDTGKCGACAEMLKWKSFVGQAGQGSEVPNEKADEREQGARWGMEDWPPL